MRHVEKKNTQDFQTQNNKKNQPNDSPGQSK